MSDHLRGSELRRTALERPLLGAGRRDVAHALDQLAALAPLDLPLQARHADLARLDGDTSATAQLLALAQQAHASGDPRLGWLCRLQARRWQLEDGQASPPLPDRPAALAADAEILAEEALLLATEKPDHARDAWLRALDGLPRPSRDHDRLAVHEVLALAEREVGDRTAARTHLEQALKLAQRHDSPADQARLSWLLVTVLLEAGHSSAARKPLEQCLALSAPASWQRVAAASTLAALQLQAGDHTAAAATAQLQLDAARARSAWLAVADASISLAACQQAEDSLTDAVRTLLAAATEARAAGVEAAVTLLKARLAELRQELGAERFDPALTQASQG